METIEIGAVFTDDSFKPLATWEALVKPVVCPILSDFCTELTTITQQEVNRGLSFPEAMQQLEAFAIKKFGKPLRRMHFCSWGNFDMNQLKKDCAYHGIEYPMGIHRNLKTEHAEKRGKKPCGVAKALKIHNLEFEGTHHRALPDAKMITKIAEVSKL